MKKLSMLLMLITLGSGSAVASDWSVSSEGERADATPSERMTFAALKPAFWGDDQRVGMMLHLFGNMKSTSTFATVYCPGVFEPNYNEMMVFSEARVRVGQRFYKMVVGCNRPSWSEDIIVNAHATSWSENAALIADIQNSMNTPFLESHIKMGGFKSALKELEYIHRVDAGYSLLK